MEGLEGTKRTPAEWVGNIRQQMQRHYIFFHENKIQSQIKSFQTNLLTSYLLEVKKSDNIFF